METKTTIVESILAEAETMLPELHVAILAREVKKLRERPDDDTLQKLLNKAYRKGNQDAHAARDACMAYRVALAKMDGTA